MINKLVNTVLLIVMFFFFACNTKENTYQSSIENSISFFDKAYDINSGVYFSEVNYSGDTISSKIHTVALSRMIYGLAYAGQYNNEYLNKAHRLSEYQLAHMIAADKDGPYYIPELDNGAYNQPGSFDIWQQAYGACGLTELYRQTKNDELLQSIHYFNEAFIQRFQDQEFGGFYGEYSVKSAQVSGSKTIQSLMYPITALMGNLWLADIENRLIYEQVIQNNLAIAYKHVWNDSLKWVNTRFDDKWNPINSEDDVVSPGHNFQFAAVLLRSAKWKFIPETKRKAYTELGKEIIAETLKKDIWVNNQISQGFYEAVNPLTNQIQSKYKSWWQHCEAIIALSFLQDDFNEEYKALVDFYFATFPDKINGGEWAKVDAFNKPVIEAKGQKGKSVYHHIEMIRFMKENIHRN